MVEKKKEMPSLSVNGYIITVGNRDYLGIFGMGLKGDENDDEIIKKTRWSPRDKPEKAWVFSAEMTHLIKESLENDDWKTKPTHIIPATWSEDGGVVVTGEKMKIEDLPPLEKN